MRCFTRADGVLVAAVGQLWVAFSAATGETSLINDESAAILELLELGPATTASICFALRAEDDGPLDSMTEQIDECWPQLLGAGLVREHDPAGAHLR
jgi:hypothetical protein